MKYSGDGRRIEVHAVAESQEVIIHVIDYGIGIARDEQKKIFQEFYRVDDPKVRQTGGSGLGLAVVKHIIDGHTGKLKVDSQPGRGSTFSIHLPVQVPQNLKKSYG